jgi:hypothetical protein
MATATPARAEQGPALKDEPEAEQTLVLKDGQEIPVSSLARKNGLVFFQTTRGRKFSVAEHHVAAPPLSSIPTVEDSFAESAVQRGKREKINLTPVVTGYTGVVGTREAGEVNAVPLINPILLVPFGERWLIEAEFEFEAELERSEEGHWGREFERAIEYFQVDFLASRHVTIVAGRFLTPFGIFNERLHPIWIKKIQQNPLIFPLGAGSSNGVMLRGGFRVDSGVNLNYAGYYSAETTEEVIEAKRVAGTRWSVFLPNQRLEIGSSLQRQLQHERFNTFGFDATWQSKSLPLDFRTEYARSDLGSGYWVEGAYRLFRKSEFAVRLEQFFAPHKVEAGEERVHAEEELDHAEEMAPEVAPDVALEGEVGHHGLLPELDTRRLVAGWNYYFRDGLRFSFSYGRDVGSQGYRKVWTLAIAHRF